MLLVRNEVYVSDALERFTENPSNMFQSLENIKAVLKCLENDGISWNGLEIKPLDVFR